MNHHINIFNALFGNRSVSNITFDKINLATLQVATNILQSTRRQVVNNSNPTPVINQSVNHVATDKTRPASHQNFLIFS
jgi:hypothetical protein